MLGNNYAPEFFDGCDPKASDPLKRICEETLEDLEGFKTILQDFGVKVIQPELDINERFLDNPHKPPRGPLQPRDCQLVIGNTLVYTHFDHPAIKNCLDQYNNNDVFVVDDFFPNLPMIEHCFNNFAQGAADWPTYDEYCYRKTHNMPISDIPAIQKEFDKIHSDGEYSKSWKLYSGTEHFPIMAPTITLVGNDIYLDRVSNNETQTLDIDKNFSWLNQGDFKNFRKNYLTVGGHSDACFHTVKPGAILSVNDIQTYEETFPGWDVCYLPDATRRKVKSFIELKKKNQGKWWLAGEEDNDEFTNFVETWLGDWVGYVEETVFDVNVLMLDEHHCCVSNPNNEQVNAFLKKHKIEPVHVPWRHRYFWDGGLHCITLDLYREGTQKDYFPERLHGITDAGF
jgi:hypothetical protein